MSAFLQQAEDILDVAVAGNTYGAGDVAILLDRQGGMRMLDPAGWTLPAMSAEYGATAVYKVERRSGTVRVEGWGGGLRCLIQREVRPRETTQFLPWQPTLNPLVRLGYL
ncbi:MAG TPA: hypothetical protein VNY05_18645 [Candidatus Acidoferrales bacterium]|nr:hypothetical protein [Candidatus Acidoferrales bacterium]